MAKKKPKNNCEFTWYCSDNNVIENFKDLLEWKYFQLCQFNMPAGFMHKIIGRKTQ